MNKMKMIAGIAGALALSAGVNVVQAQSYGADIGVEAAKKVAEIGRAHV